MFKLILAAALAGLAYAYCSLGSPALEGTTWEVKVRKDAFLAISHGDTLSFERGLFTSSRYLAKGFKPGGYASRGGQDGAFQASQACGDGASLEWRGAVHGDLVEGTVLWSRPGRESKTYAFHGRRKTG
jgi:hypothetical protein